MSFSNQVVVVIGATGVVGSGVVRKYLDAGATVVGVSRSEENLTKLKTLLNIGDNEPFHGVVGDFKDEASAQAAYDAVSAAVGGKAIDHVVTVQGFVTMTQSVLGTPLTVLKSAFDDGLYNNFLAAKVFLPQLKDRDGASFTLVSGGLAHIPPPMAAVWLGGVKGAAINALTNALITETAQDKVRVNTVCIHFGVAPIGSDKNQFGMPTQGNGLRLAPIFLHLAGGTTKSKILCINSFDEAEQIAGVTQSAS